jgi:hypothetical protein
MNDSYGHTSSLVSPRNTRKTTSLIVFGIEWKDNVGDCISCVPKECIKRDLQQEKFIRIKGLV